MPTTAEPQTAVPSVEQPTVTRLDFSRIAQDLQIRKVQVEAVVQLLDEDNTVPFITRYRKERTGGLNEEVIRTIQNRVGQLRHLADRKQTVLKSIEGQGKLTEELRAAILSADNPKRLEDLYLPYKPKKRSAATTARERGLEPTALAVWNRDPVAANLAELLPTLVNPEKELPTPEEVRLGIGHILAEQIAETADVRNVVRCIVWDSGKLTTAKSDKVKEGDGLDFKDYFQFTEPVRHIPAHRVLAINRGEKENVLTAKVECDTELAKRATEEQLPLAEHPHAEFLKEIASDALTRLLIPSLEREIRRELTSRAEQHAVTVFARNLRSLLLQPPLRGRRVLAIDPGFRTGCKLACLDETGNLIEESVIFPHPPHPKPHAKKAAAPPAEGTPSPPTEVKEPAPPKVYRKREEAKLKLEELIRKHRLNIIAIGNGTACRETEEVVSDVIAALEKGLPAGVLPPEEPPAPVPPPAPIAEQPAAAAQPPVADPPPTEAVAVPAEPVPAPAEPVAVAVPPAEPAPTPAAPVTVETPPAPPVAVVQEAAAPSPPLPPPPADLAYVIVNEAGASVYSASAVGREEFPGFDATLRGTISIGRRLQDPLSELVKIDPQNIGVGLYQHDVSPRQLKESLDAIIESCVNQVGVDLNTASVPLLRHVSGFNQLVAREVVEYRKQHGLFKTREQLLQVPGIGEGRYVQAAGFLKIDGGDNPLDRTWIHPESYAVAVQILTDLGTGIHVLNAKDETDELREKLKAVSPEEVAARLQMGAPTVRDILDALSRPGRDPREDLPPPIFKKGILRLEDLQPQMELKGTVLNVVDFGAFVDIGLKDSGLVHISQLANRYIKNPYEIVAVGDVVTVWVLAVDTERRRVSLTMIKPGTERKPQERRQRPQRTEEQADRPPRSRPPRARRPAPTIPPLGRPLHVVPPRQAVAGTPAAQSEQAGGPRPDRAPGAPRPAPPPRRPGRPTPKPKLTQAALQGETPLRTFGELAAFLEAKETKEKGGNEPQPVAAATQEGTPAPES
jgi:uncharacterized protein